MYKEKPQEVPVPNNTESQIYHTQWRIGTILMIFPNSSVWKFHLSNGKTRDSTTRFLFRESEPLLLLEPQNQRKPQNFKKWAIIFKRHYRLRTNGHISRTLRHFNTILDPDSFRTPSSPPRARQGLCDWNTGSTAWHVCNTEVKDNAQIHDIYKLTFQTVDTKCGWKHQYSTKLLLRIIIKTSDCQETPAKLMQFLGFFCWALILAPKKIWRPPLFQGQLLDSPPKSEFLFKKAGA